MVHNNTRFFFSLFLFPGHSAREPASIVCDDDQGILRVLAGTSLATANAGKKKLGRGLEKNEGEWTGKVEFSKEEIPGSRRSIHGCILTYSRL